MTAELHFNRFAEWRASREARPAAERAAREALSTPPPDVGAEAAPSAVEVSFTCLGADEIAGMNRRYLDRERPTDVIAFPLAGPGGGLVGDVYLCPEVAREAADERGIPADREVVRLVVHGALHVLGWEHPEGPGRESSEMYRLQEEILDRVVGGEES